MNNIQEQDRIIDPEHCHFVGTCPHGNFYTCNNCSGSQVTISDTPIQGEINTNVKDFSNGYSTELEHDYRFSHYEEDRNMSTTASLNGKRAIMICKHCGNYIKQQIL